MTLIDRKYRTLSGICTKLN